MGESKVVIYTSPTWGPCQQAKGFLSRRGVPFEEKNVVADRRLVKELVERSGQMRVPTIIVGQEVMVGFDEKALEKALQGLGK